MQEFLASIPEKLIVSCIEQNNITGKETPIGPLHIFTVAQAISQTEQHEGDTPLKVMQNLLSGGEYVVRCEKVTRWYSVKGQDHG